MNLVVAIFAGLWFWFASGCWGYTFHYVLKQPLVMALPFGILMGDIPTAMIIGATIELVYVGLISPGANIPADECFAGVISIPLALLAGAKPETAVVLAVPFGLLGTFLDQLRRTVNARWAHLADKYAADGDEKGLFRCAFTYPLAAGFVMRFPVVFVAVYFGANALESLLGYLPEWVMHGISVTGGVLPALGFAILLFVIGQKMLLPFFFIGFFAVKYLGINTMAAAVFGVCIAVLVVLISNQNKNDVLQAVGVGTNRDVDDDDDDE